MSKTDLLYTENDWKQMTVNGNNLLVEKTKVAILNYKVALEKAEVLMEHQTRCINFNIPVMPIFLISCNNLVQAYMLETNWKMADKMIQRGLFYILHLTTQQLHPQASSSLSKWVFKQIILYKDFALRSRQPEKFIDLLKTLEKDENYCLLMME